MKKQVALALAMVAAFGCMAGCKKSAANDDQTLEILISNYGYGTDWLEAEIELFKQQAWVKEKYPNLNIPKIKTNSTDRQIAITSTYAGGTMNTVDLFFSVEADAAYYFKDYKGGSAFEELTSLYESTVPGENVTVEEKMYANLASEYALKNAAGETVRYAVPWVNGSMGIIYNEALLEETMGKDYKMPNTTNEYIAMVDDLYTSITDETISPFLFSTKAKYWTSMFNQWWAQYDGLEGIDSYYSCKVYDEDIGQYKIVPDNLVQRGRYYALNTIDKLIGGASASKTADGNSAYVSSKCVNFTFTQAQYYFVRDNVAGNSKGIMMPNGNWLLQELRKTGDLQGDLNRFRMMNSPVPSELVEKLTSVETDAELSFVIDKINEAKDYTATNTEYSAQFSKTLTQEDFTTIYESRYLTNRLSGHDAFIPSYATAKGLAKDFLLFLSTDVAIETFMNSTYGSPTAYTYNYAANQALWDSIPQMQKDYLANLEKGVIVKAANSYKATYYGGLSDLYQNANFEAYYLQNNKKTAWEIFKEEASVYCNFDGDFTLANFLAGSGYTITSGGSRWANVVQYL